MTATLDMNTPEQSIKDSDNESKQQYIDKLQAQLVQNQMQRMQGRDYGRILRKYNTPTQWYQPSPVTRSIYFYDPHYQRYLHQQSKPPTSSRITTKTHVCSNTPSIRVQDQSVNQSNSQFTPRQKQTADLYNPPNYQQQKRHIPSRLQTIPTLPPIITSKKQNNE